MNPAFYVVGMILAIMMGVAVGGPVVRERGRRVALPVTIACVVFGGLIIGWALDTTISYITLSASH